MEEVRRRYEILYDWNSREEAEKVLGLRRSQRVHYTGLLCRLHKIRPIPGWNYVKNKDSGFDRDSLEVLCELHKLVHRHSTEGALVKIVDHMKEIHEQRTRQYYQQCDWDESA